MTDERHEVESYRQMLDAAPDAMVIVDADGLVTYVNRQTEALFGYARVTQQLGETAAADAIDAAVRKVIESGLRTGDIWSEGTKKLSTSEMGRAIAEAV